MTALVGRPLTSLMPKISDSGNVVLISAFSLALLSASSSAYDERVSFGRAHEVFCPERAWNLIGLLLLTSPCAKPPMAWRAKRAKAENFKETILTDPGTNNKVKGSWDVCSLGNGWAVQRLRNG